MQEYAVNQIERFKVEASIAFLSLSLKINDIQICQYEITSNRQRHTHYQLKINLLFLI